MPFAQKPCAFFVKLAPNSVAHIFKIYSKIIQNSHDRLAYCLASSLAQGRTLALISFQIFDSIQKLAMQFLRTGPPLDHGQVDPSPCMLTTVTQMLEASGHWKQSAWKAVRCMVSRSLEHANDRISTPGGRDKELAISCPYLPASGFGCHRTVDLCFVSEDVAKESHNFSTLRLEVARHMQQTQIEEQPSLFRVKPKSARH